MVVVESECNHPAAIHVELMLATGAGSISKIQQLVMAEHESIVKHESA